jgi:hypothetical protein
LPGLTATEQETVESEMAETNAEVKVPDGSADEVTGKSCPSVSPVTKILPKPSVAIANA